MGKRRGADTILVGKPEGRRLLVRHGHRWEDNIKMYLQEFGSSGVGWINLASDR